MDQLTLDHVARLDTIRREFHQMLAAASKIDGSRLGEGEISLIFPPFYDAPYDKVAIHIRSYLLCDGRYELCEGATWNECLDKLEHTLGRMKNNFKQCYGQKNQ